MLRAQDFMSRNVKTIDAGESATNAYDTMRNNRIHHLVVVQTGKPVGIVSERDLGGARGSALRDGRKVADVMTSQITTAKPKSTLREIANQMRGRAIGCLPVCEDGHVKGIVTMTDLLNLLGRGVQHVVPKGERPSLKNNPRWRRS